MSETVFEKHDYRNQKKRKLSLTEDFDPRPVELLLDTVRGESLGVSLLFDPKYRQVTTAVNNPDPSIPDTCVLKETIVAFKESLKLSAEKLREIEQTTREQRNSSLWFSLPHNSKYFWQDFEQTIYHFSRFPCVKHFGATFIHFSCHNMGDRE